MGSKKITVKESPNIQHVAEWFLSKSPMTHKKLQKLCYYAVAWGWALMDHAIVDDSDFQAWIHGPVSKVLYDKYKHFKWNLIPLIDESPKFAEDIQELLESVWVTYGAKDGNELEALSHAEKPWRQARAGALDDEPGYNTISSESMRDYYWSIYNGKSETDNS